MNWTFHLPAPSSPSKMWSLSDIADCKIQYFSWNSQSLNKSNKKLSKKKVPLRIGCALAIASDRPEESICKEIHGAVTHQQIAKKLNFWMWWKRDHLILPWFFHSKHLTLPYKHIYQQYKLSQASLQQRKQVRDRIITQDKLIFRPKRKNNFYVQDSLQQLNK